MMRLLSALVVTTMLTASAYAQTPHINLLADDKPSKSTEEKEQDAIKDKAYRDSLRKIPDAKTSSDPWGTVRSSDAPKTAGKPKAKTGSAQIAQ